MKRPKLLLASLGILLAIISLSWKRNIHYHEKKLICSAENSNSYIASKALTEPGRLTSLRLDKMQQVKSKINDPEYKPGYDKLIRYADRKFKEGPYSVMQKSKTPPSGDKHDYYSLGPYWWPDPDKADGLPWINRDGQINPETLGEHTDKDSKNETFKNIRVLSLAAFYSDQKKYAKRANLLLDTWFLDPETKMNPNLNFAQGVPGKSEGRGFGIIEFAGVIGIVDAIELLSSQGNLSRKTTRGLKEWLSEYLKWLQNSEMGLFEKSRTNNHGTWYDAQVTCLLIFLDRQDEAKKYLETVKGRIASQIEPDGSQPHELRRTKSLSYSTMNLKAFTMLAYYAKGLGEDLWSYTTPDGRGIQKAYDYLELYASGREEWEHEQITDIDKARENLAELFQLAGCYFDRKDYCALDMANVEVGYRENLFYPCNPM